MRDHIEQNIELEGTQGQKGRNIISVLITLKLMLLILMLLIDIEYFVICMPNFIGIIVLLLMLKKISWCKVVFLCITGIKVFLYVFMIAFVIWALQGEYGLGIIALIVAFLGMILCFDVMSMIVIIKSKKIKMFMVTKTYNNEDYKGEKIMNQLDFPEILKENSKIRSALLVSLVTLFIGVIVFLNMTGAIYDATMTENMSHTTNIVIIIICFGIIILFSFGAIKELRKMNYIFQNGEIVQGDITKVKRISRRTQEVEYKFEFEGTECRGTVGLKNTLSFNSYYYIGKEVNAHVLKNKKGQVMSAFSEFKKI